MRPPLQHRDRGRPGTTKPVPHVRERPSGQADQPPQIPVTVDHRRTAAHTRPAQRQLCRVHHPQRVQVEHLPGPSQHVGVDHIALVLPADRPPQPGGMPRPQQRQLTTRVGQRHRQPQPGHRRRLRDRHHPRCLSQPAGQRPQPGQRRRHPEPISPDPTISLDHPQAHFMLRDHRSIDPDPHQPRQVSTTLNKHEGSPSHRRRARPSPASEQTARSPTREGPRATRGISPAQRFPTHHRSSRPLPRLWVIRCPAQAGHRVADQPRAHQFPSTGTTGQETDPRAADLFHEPEHSPGNRHTQRPSQATVATTHTVAGTPFN